MSSLQQQQRPSPSRIRKRPVSFGNPALGTYKGNVFTLEDNNLSNMPLVEGAETVEQMVAMVDVPPEQVPEGILHLARSHRPFIDHVRIVIAEVEPKACTSKSSLTSLKHGREGTTANDYTIDQNNSIQLPPDARKSAASILAEESKEFSHREEQYGQQEQGQSLLWPLDDDNQQKPTRTYLVLFHLLSEKDATTFVEDLHRKPFTSLDETVKCSVHRVVALQGEDGVSIFSPMFAPSTKKSHGTLEILPSSSSTDDDNHIETNHKIDSTQDSAGQLTEDPNCAVCLEHMSLDPFAEDKTAILTTVCNHTFHLDCLVQCQDSPCPVCRYDHSGLNETLSQCHLCGTTEHNYVCLICGVVSCVAPTATVAAAPPSGDTSCNTVGALPNNTESNETAARRFYTSHAGQHYHETLHAYALDTETQHVWDFAGNGYVHRLLQNKEDGKLVEVNDPNNTTSQERSLNPGLSDAQEGEVVHRKLEGFASQYYTLLKSQLEQQRIFYEGRLQEIRREFSIKQTTATKDKSDLVAVLRQERKQLAHRLVCLKKKKDKVMEDTRFLKSMNESLEANKAPLERKIKQAQRERIESQRMIQKYLPALEEKVTFLMLQLEESMNTVSVESEKECASDK